METLSTAKERYEELKKIPLLFLHLNSYTIEKESENGTEYETVDYWEPVGQICRGKILKDSFPTTKGNIP